MTNFPSLNFDLCPGGDGCTGNRNRSKQMNNLSSVRIFFGLILLTLGFPSSAALEINRTENDLFGDVGLSVNALDRMLVTWAECERNVVCQQESAAAYAQFVSSDGNLIDSIIPLNSIQSAYNPQVFLNDDGSFIAAWESQPAGTKSQIYIRFFDTLGIPTGTEVFVDIDEDTFEFLERIAVLSNGDFIVYWSESGNLDGPLFRRTFKSDGAPVAAREDIIPTAAFAQSDFAQFSDAGYYGIAQEAFNSVSLFSTVPFTVADLMPFQLASGVTGGIADLSVSVNSNNRLVAGWRQDSGLDSEYYFTITQGDSVIANQVLAIDEYLDHPSASISGAGNILIARAGIAPGTTGGEVNNAIIASLFSADGAVIKSDFLLDGAEISSMRAAHTQADSSGNFFIAWTGSAPASAGIKEVIRLQKVDETGATLWNQDNDGSEDSGSGSGGGSKSLLMLILMLSLTGIKFSRRINLD